ncbi:PDLIM7 isoform 17, partial [Pongo abelii]
ISRLTPGGKAAQAGVAVGDWVLSIDGENAGSLTHIEAQNKIRACGERLSLGLSRAQPVQSKPQKAPHFHPGPHPILPARPARLCLCPGLRPRRGPSAVHLCTQRLPQQDGPALWGAPAR